jgi:beta-lactamase class A
MLRLLARLFLLLILSFGSGAFAQPGLTPQAALARILKETPAKADWFDLSFLTHLKPSQIDDIVKQYTGQYGAFQRVEGKNPDYTVVLERGSFPAKISLSTEGLITGLWFGVAEPLKAASLEDTLKDFDKLPGKIGALVTEDGKVRASRKPDEPLAVGSAFKLAVLASLSGQAAAGKHRKDEVIPLRSAWKSLPSGVLLEWPDGTPLTLATYENEMISISDNTAADALISITGRESIEALASRNKPFLTTREAFILKAPANSALLARYRKADEAGRRALLPDIDALSLPDVSVFDSGPLATDIEWFFTSTELCSLIEKVKDLPAMHINPGVAKPSEWQQIAYKGGSEPGVLNLTTAMTGKNGKHYCVTATWNNSSALDENRLFTLYGGLLSSLAKESAKP